MVWKIFGFVLVFAGISIIAAGFLVLNRFGNRLSAFSLLPVKAASYPAYNTLTEQLRKEIIRKGCWHMVLGPGGKAEAEIQNGVGTVRIADGGTEWYSVQFCFLPMGLEKNCRY